jgi:Helicase HerA, central domain
MTARRNLALGGVRPLDGSGDTTAFGLPPNDLLTHGVVLGMTGSGKTGLLLVLVEEALRSRVPVIMVDVKGDLPNLLLSFPTLSAEELAPWLDAGEIERSGRSRQELAEQHAQSLRERLAVFGLGPEDAQELRARMAPRVLTPGMVSAEPLHVLSPLERPGRAWTEDEESARESLSASISLLLRLLGRDADPTRSRDHVVLSVLAERRLKLGLPADVASLLGDVREPPIERMGALPLDEFLPKKDRQSLATALNTLLASPTFESWRTGASLDVEEWLAPRADGRTPAVIVSVAHLDDDERALVLGIVLDQLLAWVRTLPGTHDLRALLVFDEVYGFIPPHPANPPTKRPLVTLMKQARGFGLGVVLATQNPMDLDYRALSNAGVWCVGRLATDADRARVVEALESEGAAGPLIESDTLDQSLKALSQRWFVLRNVHQSPALTLLQSRTALSWMRGPMTRQDLKRALAEERRRTERGG